MYVTVVDCCIPLLEDELPESYYETVKLDSGSPSASLLVSFEDCADTTCGTSPAVKLLFTSTDVGECATLSCCGDYCSGPAAWSLVFEESVCGAGCTPVTGPGCPIAGDTGCDCLVYATATEGTLTYDGTFTFKDKVGWKVTEVWEVVVDTDEVVSFTANGTTHASPAYNTATVKTNTITVDIGSPSTGDTYCGFVE